MSFDVIRVKGTPYDVGYELGKRFSEVAKRAIDVLYNAKIVKKSIPKYIPKFVLRWTFRRLAKKVRAKVKKHYPFIDEYAVGFAEGAGIDVITVYEVNMFENIAGRPDRRYKVQPQQCTGIVTKRYVGKNYDYPDEFEEFQFVRIWKMSDNYATMALAHHILPGTHAGMNEYGLGLVYTYVESRDGIIENIPTTIVLEAMLQIVKTVDDAVEFLKKAPRATGANIFLTDGKRNVIVEYSPTRINVREGKEVLVAANHFVSEVMQDVNLPEDKVYPVKDFKVPIIKSSRIRYERINQLVKPDMTLKDIMNIFKDHYPEPGEDSICRHGPYWHTLASIIFDIVEKKMYASKGNPCKNPYKEYLFEI